VAALVACGGVERTHRALLHRKPLLLLPRSSADHELALKLSALRVAVQYILHQDMAPYLTFTKCWTHVSTYVFLPSQFSPCIHSSSFQVAIDMDFVNEATPEASGPVCSYWSDVLNEGLWRLLLDPKVLIRL